MEVEAGTHSKDPNTLLTTHNRSSSNRRKKMCLIYTAGIVAAIVVILVILGLTVFKPKDPKITPNSVDLENFSASLDLPRIRVLLNVSLRIDLSVENPNVVGMRYKNATSLVYYRDELIGEVPIPAGKIGGHDNERMNVTLVVLADRLVSNANTYSDVIAGSIQFTIVTEISGKVKILNMFSISVKAMSTCVVDIDTKNRAVSSSSCHTKAKT